MQQLLKVWTQLGLRRQIIVVLATGAMFFAIIAMSRMATAPSMTLLYAGLENGAAGDVVRALEQRGVAYEVRGGSIFVDSQQRDELRLTLASEGLPANSNRLWASHIQQRRAGPVVFALPDWMRCRLGDDGCAG